MEWKNTDPRLDINKRAQIVILRPSEKGHFFYAAGVGYVETKDVYCIFTDFGDHRLIHADQEWDSSWKWIFAPKE